MKALIIVKGTLPALNDYIAAMNLGRHAGNDMKAEAVRSVGWFARQEVQQRPIWSYPLRITFTWVESNRRRDKDNIAFAKKFILDALQPFHQKLNPYGVGIIDGDGWKHIDGFDDRFAVDAKNPRIEILIEEARAK